MRHFLDTVPHHSGPSDLAVVRRLGAQREEVSINALAGSPVILLTFHPKRLSPRSRCLVYSRRPKMTSEP